jgi:predicted MFS family arabinose efflux permease
VLALTETVSYGVLLYAFAVMLVPMQADLGWSQATLTGAFSLAALTAGVVALPVGRWLDRRGARGVMTAGSAAATLLLLAWSRVDHPVTYYLVWIGLGACMAAVFYEPAFAVVARWFHEQRTRALTIITLAAGLASTIFVPLAAALVAAHGWRTAVAWLAVMLGALTVLPHALLLRREPADLGLEVDGRRRVRIGERLHALSPAAHNAAHARNTRIRVDRRGVRSHSFQWLSVAFMLSGAAGFAVAVHLIPLLLARGHSSAWAGGALAALGLCKLPGRLLLAPVEARLSMPVAAIGIFVLQLGGLLALITVPGVLGVGLFVVLFGGADGASTPARASIIADFYGAGDFGRISGVMAPLLAVARAAAPAGGSLLQVWLGGYDALVVVLCANMAGAAGAMAAAVRHHRNATAPGPDVHDLPLPVEAPASFPGRLRLPG